MELITNPLSVSLNRSSPTRNCCDGSSLRLARFASGSTSHRGSSKTRAAEIFCAANSGTSVSQFNSKVWNTARNKVFHGRSYPSPAYLGELASTSESLRKAAERRIAEIAGIPQQRAYYRYEDLYRVFFFVEWNTSAPEQQFAADWPQALLASRTAKAELNQVFMEAAPENATFLDYAQSATW